MFHLILQRRIKKEIQALSPWYQPIDFGHGIKIMGVDKAGHCFGIDSKDRGIAKWSNFIQPNLPFELKGKRVLEIGCNAGLFLNECARQGALEVVGIEKDDRYYQQARFVARTFSELDKRHYPVRIFKGSMDNFDFESIGKFDLALLLAVIYHIGKSADYSHLNTEEIFELQVKTLHNISRIAKYLLFQAYTVKDNGRGYGKNSLLELVNHADLEIVKESTYDHPRGYILLTKSNIYSENETFPVSRMISKYFLPVHLSAEREVVDLYVKHGKKNPDISGTRYYQLRTAQLDWRDNGVAKLPSSLDREPTYWVVPWSYRLKSLKKNQDEIKKRIKKFPQLCGKFFNLVDSILDIGFDSTKGSIPGYLLIHPKYGKVFIYIDGNQRMSVLSHIAEQSSDNNFSIPVKVLHTIEREKLLSYPLTRQLIEEGYFTDSDVFKWFDTAFWFITDEAS